MRMGYRTIPVIGWDPHDEHIGVERASTHNTFKQYDDLVSFQNQFYVDQVFTKFAVFRHEKVNSIIDQNFYRLIEYMYFKVWESGI